MTRLVTIGALLGYLWVLRLFLGKGVEDLILVVLQVWFALAVLNAVTFYWVPGTCVPRRVVTLAGDLTVAAAAAYLGGELLAPFFAAYVGVIVGYGIRYGRAYLLVATAGGALGFLWALVGNDYWSTNTLPGLGFLFTLVVIPMVAHGLMRDARTAKEAALAASRAKSEFAATLSHEIRTPLASITALADMIARQGERRGDGQVETARLVHAACRMLLSLTEDILDLSAIEAGEFSLSRRRVNPYRFLEASLDTVRPVAELKGLELVGSVDLGVPAAVTTDERRLAQVLLNLVSNAIKYTNEGWVRVQLTASDPSRDGARARLRFEVHDSGIGFPDGLSGERLFRRFARQSDVAEGAGLGMAIAAEIAEQLDGRIGVEPTEVGAMFWFELPVEVPGHRRPTRSPAPAPPGTRALVVGRGCAEVVFDTVRQPVPARFLDVEGVTEDDAALQPEDVVFLARGLEEAQTRRLEQVCRARKVPIVVHELAGASPPPPPFGRIWGVHVGPVTGATLARARLLRGGGTGAEGAAGTGGPRILVAEDDPLNAMALTLLLASLGCRYEVAGDGAAAYRLLAQCRFDLAFIDSRMPELDGLEVIRRLAEDGVETPLVVVSADASRETIAAAMDAGAADYILKPVTTEELERALLTWAPAVARPRAHRSG